MKKESQESPERNGRDFLKTNGRQYHHVNAPTALFTLCELISQGLTSPSLVVGTPVGFVGAEESKDLLMNMAVPYITVPGTKGGSTIAAAVVNALLYLA